MKKIPKAIMVEVPRYEHGDVVEFKRQMPNGVVGEVGIVCSAGPETFECYAVASRETWRVRHDSPEVTYVGRVTKTSFKPSEC